MGGASSVFVYSFYSMCGPGVSIQPLTPYPLSRWERGRVKKEELGDTPGPVRGSRPCTPLEGLGLAFSALSS